MKRKSEVCYSSSKCDGDFFGENNHGFGVLRLRRMKSEATVAAAVGSQAMDDEETEEATPRSTFRCRRQLQVLHIV
ncbi:Hypothetical predicted protein [Octopus vulgaris]|uniref:Uncharacterized protein n=1 Tax=Octopus vulgaris TaxID=6645 RepID=A0AA36BUM1_OCTVU|nr:Hypothetical predicted protein [Octopus vulgaris]